MKCKGVIVLSQVIQPRVSDNSCMKKRLIKHFIARDNVTLTVFVIWKIWQLQNLILFNEADNWQNH